MKPQDLFENTRERFPPAKQDSIEPLTEAMTKVASTRAAQEIQAAMIIAKRCPRDIEAAYARIIQACRRARFAENALYEYPRGGTQITGPSIRMAELLAQNWGNLDFGIIELEQRDGESTTMAYAWDLETNTRQTKIFQVKHERKARGGITKLDDPRDIYELVANMGARRMRACILGVIPGDIVDAAIEACELTLKTAEKEPLIDRVRKMSAAFLENGVSAELLERRLGHKLAATSEIEMVRLRKIYVSLRDGMSKINDWFAPNGAGPVERGTLDMADARPGNVADHTEPGKTPGAPAPASAEDNQLLRDVSSVFADDPNAAFDVLASIDPELPHKYDWTLPASIPTTELERFVKAWSKRKQQGKSTVPSRRGTQHKPPPAGTSGR